MNFIFPQNYNFDNKYYLTGTLRRDGSSLALSFGGGSSSNHWLYLWCLEIHFKKPTEAASHRIGTGSH